MKPIGQALQQVRDSLPSRRNSGHAAPAVRVDPAHLPAPYRPETDRDLPRKLWCGYSIAGHPKTIRRELTEKERSMLQARAAELEPALESYHPDETDEVALAISDMLGGFKGERQTGADVVAKIDSLRRLLQPFPAWAIVGTCLRLRMEGYDVRTDQGVRREKHWSPSDGELVDEVRKTLKPRRDALVSAQALLEAPVER